MIPDAATNVKEEGTAFQDSCMEKNIGKAGRTFAGESTARKLRGICFFFF